MEHFTPFSAAIGGVLIGLSATLLWVSNGRIAGISGVVGGLWNFSPGDLAWRLAFIVGLMASPVLVGWAGGELPKIIMSAPRPIIIGAGLLVGFGTRLGSGCTSGHGVCGLARFSPRSAAATGIFMSVAVLTCHLFRHWVGI
jgi:uncharacterized membrane protein YedE/YeeE